MRRYIFLFLFLVTNTTWGSKRAHNKTQSPSAVESAANKQKLLKGPAHICYFSLNNPKEFRVMEKFVARANKKAPDMFSVKEYLPEGKSVEESFVAMIEENKKQGKICDGLVISGHHTGSFGGERGSGNLDIDFLEKISCDPKYKDWFTNIKALWLQGCRTLGVKISPNNAADPQNSADFHAVRVQRVADEDHLEQGLGSLNREFSDTLDQDNPLSSRYLRVFPRATVFGWTETAPGMNAQSELSIPFHMAHMAKLNDDNAKFFKSIDTAEETSLKKSADALYQLLKKDQCQNLMQEKKVEANSIQAWLRHGNQERIKPNKINECSLQNPDLNACHALCTKEGAQDPVLELSRQLNCSLKGFSGDGDLLKAVDAILQDERLLAYNFNGLLSLAQSDTDKKDKSVLNLVKNKFQHSKMLKDFLVAKINSPTVGIVRKLDYLAGYREMVGADVSDLFKALEPQIFATLNKKVEPSDYAQRDFQLTLVESLADNKFLSPELIKIALADKDVDFVEAILDGTKPEHLDEASKDLILKAAFGHGLHSNVISYLHQGKFGSIDDIEYSKKDEEHVTKNLDAIFNNTKGDYFCENLNKVGKISSFQRHVDDVLNYMNHQESSDLTIDCLFGILANSLNDFNRNVVLDTIFLKVENDSLNPNERDETDKTGSDYVDLTDLLDAIENSRVPKYCSYLTRAVALTNLNKVHIQNLAGYGSDMANFFRLAKANGCKDIFLSKEFQTLKDDFITQLTMKDLITQKKSHDYYGNEQAFIWGLAENGMEAEALRLAKNLWVDGMRRNVAWSFIDSSQLDTPIQRKFFLDVVAETVLNRNVLVSKKNMVGMYANLLSVHDSLESNPVFKYDKRAQDMLQIVKIELMQHRWMMR